MSKLLRGIAAGWGAKKVGRRMPFHDCDLLDFVVAFGAFRNF